MAEPTSVAVESRFADRRELAFLKHVSRHPRVCLACRRKFHEEYEDRRSAPTLLDRLLWAVCGVAGLLICLYGVVPGAVRLVELAWRVGKGVWSWWGI